MGYIYIHTNRVNGKKYVGQITLEPKYRWNNGEGYRECPKFYRAIQKYGWDNFEHESYEMDDLLLDGMERFLIEYYHTMDKDFGYNCESGGRKNKHLSEETKRKMSESRMGEKNPNYGRTGEKSPWYGKHRSEETKKKISKSHEKFHYMIQSPNGEIFETTSLRAFCKENGLSRRGMSYDGHSKGYILLSKEDA